jgi:general secretion pathway protein D
MMPKLSRQRWTWSTVLLSLLAMVAIHTALAQTTTIRVEIPSEGPKAGGESFSVNVVVDDVTNLGAFEFQLTYDPSVVELQDFKEGPFLGSSGRRVECLPPRSEEGSLDFTCVTLGATPDGPTGSGVLATLTFQPVGAGTSSLHLKQVVLADPPANRLPAQAEDASVTVGQTQEGGFRWVLWGPVIGGAGVALAAAAAAGTWWLRRRPC